MLLLHASLIFFCAIFFNQNQNLVNCDCLNRRGLELLEQQTCGNFVAIKVANGHEVRLGSRPWMALLLLRKDEEQDYGCGGTLITNRFVLTAAHCLARFELVSVRLGEHQISTENDCRHMGRRHICTPPVEDIGVDRVFIHDNYNSADGHCDIALVKLARNVEFKNHIKPICLPITEALQQQSDTTNTYLVTGWGLTEQNMGSDVLLETNIQLQSSRLCRQSFLREIADSQLCVGHTNSDSCKGDSGGPLSYPSLYMNRQRFVQFGIVSYGATNCGSGYPGVYTKVGSFMPWITNILAENS